jgi:hypothetical protein
MECEILVFENTHFTHINAKPVWFLECLCFFLGSEFDLCCRISCEIASVDVELDNISGVRNI